MVIEMAREHCLGACAVLILIVFLSITPGIANGVMYTSDCAWTIEEGRQGRARCGLVAGPCDARVSWSRTFHGGGYIFSPICVGPDDVILLTVESEREGKHTVIMLDRDGHQILCLKLEGGTQNTSGPRSNAISDSQFYIKECYYPDDDLHLSCWDFSGNERWGLDLRFGEVVPVDGRGLAVIYNEGSDRGQMRIFDEEGGLLFEDTLNGWPYRAAFNAGGVATWAYYTWDYNWPLGGYAEWFCASELNPQGVSIHSGYFDSHITYPGWSIYYTKVNGLGNVFVSARKKVAAFADASLETKLWEYTPDGFTVWEDACGDPSGAWYVVYSTPDEDDGIGKLKLLRIGPDGTKSWHRSIGRPSGYSRYDQMCKCDSDGNVYYAFEGEVISLDPNGDERWRITFPQEYADILALDSSGAVYVRGLTDQTALFALSDGPPHHSRVRAKFADGAKAAEYQAGDELVILLQPYNFGDDQRVDAYLAVVAPDGSVFYFDGSGFSFPPTPWFTDVFMPNLSLIHI